MALTGWGPAAWRDGRAAACGLLVLSLVSVWPRCADAQTYARPVTDMLGALDAHLDQAAPSALQLRLGVGGVLTSRLDDAPNLRVYPLPYLSLQYKDVLSIDETQVRVNLIAPDSALGRAGFKAGPMLRIDPGRGNINRPGVPGLSKIAVSLEGGGYVAYSVGPARVRLRLREALTGGHGGTVAELEFRSGLFRRGAFGAGVQVATVWGSRTYINAFYGVTPAQAAATGLRLYTPGAGFKDVNAAVFAEYKISPRWAMLGAAQFVRLVGGPANSPIAERRGLTNRVNFGLFAIYTFGAGSAKSSKS